MGLTPTIWITGLSRSGKTILAQGLANSLQAEGIHTQILDGSAVREDIGNFLGYSREERMKVNRIMCSIASLLNKNGVVVIATSITPYLESRALNRATLESYFEIFLDCSLDVCMERDDKNNYARALRGDLKHFIGVDDPFEVPKSADLTINTNREDVAATLSLVLSALDGILRQ